MRTDLGLHRRPAPAEPAPAGLQPIDAVAALVLLGFLLWGGSHLGAVLYDLDEGAYIIGGRKILQGLVPMRDFFVHQIPMYEAALGAVAGLFGTSFMVARGFSLVCAALIGVLVYGTGRRHLGPEAALIALVVLLFAPLMIYARLAMPNIPMALCEVAAVVLVVDARWRGRLILAGLLFVVAAAFKPLAASTALLMTAYLLWQPATRYDGWRLMAAGAAWTAVLALVLVGSGAAAVFNLVWVELRRVTVTGWDIVMGYNALRDVAELHGASGPFSWNWRMIWAVFGPEPDPGKYSNAPIAVLAIVGAVLLRRTRPATPLVRICALWIAAALAFDLWVWFPVLEHYFIQILPPLALIAGGGLATAGARWVPRRRWRWPMLATLCGGAIAAAHGTMPTTPYGDYRYLGQQIRAETAAYQARLAQQPISAADEAAVDPRALDGQLLTFNAFLNVIADIDPACRLYDPANQIGKFTLTGYDDDPKVNRFNMGYGEVLDCFDDDPSIFLFVDRMSFIVIRNELVPAIFALPKERVLTSDRMLHQLAPIPLAAWSPPETSDRGRY